MRSHWQSAIAGLTFVLIALHLVLRFGFRVTGSFHGIVTADAPLLTVLAFGGVPLVLELLVHVFKREFGSDLLAGLSIVVSVMLGEYLAGALVVLMLLGGRALEAYAVRRASSVLDALARRMPSVAHRTLEGVLTDVTLDDVAIGDALVVFPHEDLPRRRRGPRRPWRDGRVVSHRRAVRDVEDTGGERAIRRRQRRLDPDDSGGPEGRRFAVRADHAGHARLGTAASAVAALGRSIRCLVHAARGRDRRLGLVGERRSRSGFSRCWWWRRRARC